MKAYGSLIAVGLLSGTVLGLLLKGAERLTGLTVYKLLLGVDYIPGLRVWLRSEASQFALHLLISVGFTVVAGAVALRRFRHPGALRFLIGSAIAVGLLLYPTTVLSTGTPSLLDVRALGIWLAAHALYGWLIAFLLLHLLRLRPGTSVP